MKFGVRKPSINRSIKARATGRIKRSANKAFNPLYGKKGMGLINNPKKAIYNKAYNKTTVSARDIGKTASGSSVVAMIYLALIAIILYLFLDGWWKIIPIVLGIISLAGMVGLYVQLIQFIAKNYVVSFILFTMLGSFFYFFCDWLGVYPATIPIALIVTYIIGLLYPNPKVDELVEEIEEPEVDEEDLRIKKLEGLLAVGLLTQEEFDEKMKEI